MSDVPSFSTFNPKLIKSQWRVVQMIRNRLKYDEGPHEILLSGSVGSAKSILAAHLAVDHCVRFSGARVLLGRRTLPDLKDTIFQDIRDHLEDDFIQGDDYDVNETRAKIVFANGSEIISRSWADKKYKSKFRSVKASACIIEELTENDSVEFEAFHTEMIGRIGRINKRHGVPENWCLYATNPDSPAHKAYDYFVKGAKVHPRRHVVYSRTVDNPFLPTWYVDNLRNIYSAKICERLIEGKWVYLDSDSLYYSYDPDRHFILEDTKPSERYPLRLFFDFNIGFGKPQSSALGFYDEIRRKFVFIDEVILEGTRTLDVMEEWANRGYFDLPSNPKIIIHGDASGRHRDTRSKDSDYTIIEDYLENYERKPHPVTKRRTPLTFEIDVPRSNPPLRKRHNLVNGQLCNAKGVCSIEIDKRCVTLDEGLSKTKLKPGGQYIEVEDRWQHITTAIGYGICTVLDEFETGNEAITIR